VSIAGVSLGLTTPGADRKKKAADAQAALFISKKNSKKGREREEESFSSSPLSSCSPKAGKGSALIAPVSPDSREKKRERKGKECFKRFNYTSQTLHCPA